MSTTLTLLEILLTTQAWVLENARTVTGSSPTLITLSSVRLLPLIEKISRSLFGVLTASNFVPSGVMSSGWTWADS